MALVARAFRMQNACEPRPGRSEHQMSEFLERVSRALCQNAGHDPDATHQVNSIDQENWTFFVHAARAALEAMREPTQAMIDAARNDVLLADALGVWRTMINTALSESPPA